MKFFLLSKEKWRYITKKKEGIWPIEIKLSSLQNPIVISMKKNYLLKLSLLCLSVIGVSVYAQSTETNFAEQDLNKPFGWVTCSSLTGGDYAITGGNAVSSPKTITLTSSGTGVDMRSTLTNAIKNYQIIILDGSNGDFEISKKIELKSLSNKTIVGINNARICTQFYITDEIKALLDSKGVLSASTSSGTGGTLSNGTSVSEAREYLTRQALIDYTGDSSESYRQAGIFYLSGCTNFIIRNLKLVGPGPVDVGGYDCMSCLGSSKHIWVDHCDFTDGMDGNFDITNSSDFITCSWCTFSYTDRAYDHKNTNLVGSSDSESSGLDVTYAFCEWGTGCNARMPMARFGVIHVLNNYYNCAGNGSYAINPRKNSKFLIEGNYFASGVKKIFSQSSANSWVWSSTNVTVESFSPTSSGSVTVPYEYSEMAASDVPSVVGTYAGATLTDPLTLGRETGLEAIETIDDSDEAPCYNLNGQRVTDTNYNGFLIRNGKIRIIVK